MKSTINILLFIFLAFPLTVLAQTPKQHFYYEKDYQNMWCGERSGITEYILPDKARVDCVTQTHAIEFDFAKNGQNQLGNHYIMLKF